MAFEKIQTAPVRRILLAISESFLNPDLVFASLTHTHQLFFSLLIIEHGQVVTVQEASMKPNNIPKFWEEDGHCPGFLCICTPAFYVGEAFSKLNAP